MKKLLSLLLVAAMLLTGTTVLAGAEDAKPSDAAVPGEAEGYTLEQVVILSRHNLRAPLSSNGSVPQELTPHTWTSWTGRHGGRYH